jgi:hypothetical protein
MVGEVGWQQCGLGDQKGPQATDPMNIEHDHLKGEQRQSQQSHDAGVTVVRV